MKISSTSENYINSMDNKMVSQAIELWFHFTTHFRKDEYKGGYSVEKGPSGYKGWQQEY